ncbi:LOW QUALITY PROTEIN: Interferon-induced very large GTPase 1 [Plecturocebus cupreus]
MCCVPTAIVSFIRVGNGLSASKSQIINCLLSKHKHDVGSRKDCLLMEGVVEIYWFFLGGEDEDRFDNCVTFINLHGDAKEHEQQLTFRRRSLLSLWSLSSEDNEGNRKIVHNLWQSSRSLICLVDNKEATMTNNSGQRMRIGFLTDEDQRDCKEAKEKAQVLMALQEKMKLPQIKEKLLPLQGQLWHHWCKKDRELYHLREKGNQSIEQHKSETETDKQIIQHEQLARAFPLNDLMQSVLESLQEHSEIHAKLYFLQWLSIFLDKLPAGHLEELHEKQRYWWSLIQTVKQKAPNSNSLICLQSEMEATSTEISDCTMGIEQLLREVGQIYEALEEASSIKDILFFSLPQIAADLMISGVPTELMDGDAAYVPLTWVVAIFDKVSEKLGDKQLFVLSVLGLKSSGISTLLNALSRLQFTVSADRYTQGAYMQLLKVEETFTEELGFDFMLLVDTEGLRAPELGNKSQNRDNDLTTFVIGLANLTLINIFGENPSEMQDILQMVVQAFLRMKQVKIFPSCLFVHQNVGEVTATDQTRDGRRWLEQELDEMAAAAAEQEQCLDITCFSDITRFGISGFPRGRHVCRGLLASKRVLT